MFITKRRVFFLLLVFALLLTAGPASAQDPTPAPVFEFTDGRINRHDTFAPVVPYCTAEGAVVVYDVDPNSVGTLSMVATAPMLQAALARAGTSGQNVLVVADSARGNSLWVLAMSGELQVMGPGILSPEIYTFSFPGNQCLDQPGVTLLSDLTGDLLAAATAPGTATTTTTQTNYLIVNTAFLNIRSGDGPGYTILAVVPGGTILTPIGRNERYTWWFVEHNGVQGWVNNIHVLVRGNLRNVPLQELVDAALIQPTLYVGFPGNPIYSELAAGVSVRCYLPGNAEFPVIGRNRDTSWYLIEAECDGVIVTGWIEAEKGLIRNPAALPIPVAVVP